MCFLTIFCNYQELSINDTFAFMAEEEARDMCSIMMKDIADNTSSEKQEKYALLISKQVKSDNKKSYKYGFGKEIISVIFDSEEEFYNKKDEAIKKLKNTILEKEEKIKMIKEKTEW